VIGSVFKDGHALHTPQSSYNPSSQGTTVQTAEVVENPARKVQHTKESFIDSSVFGFILQLDVSLLTGRAFRYFDIE